MCSCGREFDTPQALWDHYVNDGASDEERESHGATTTPREPCCDLASRGTHRKGCTGEPRSKQLADALGGEAALTDAEVLSRADQHALRAMIGYIARCGSRTLGEDALAACRAAVAARKEPKP